MQMSEFKKNTVAANSFMVFTGVKAWFSLRYIMFVDGINFQKSIIG